MKCEIVGDCKGCKVSFFFFPELVLYVSIISPYLYLLHIISIFNMQSYVYHDVLWSNGEAGPNNFNRWLQQSFSMGSDTSDPPLFRPLEEHRHDQHYTSSVNLISENIN